MHISTLTLQSNGILKEIITDVAIFDSIYREIKTNKDPRVLETKALWDTGATNCAITPSCAKTLDLKPISIVEVRHAGGTSFANVYLINVILPNGVALKDVRFSECSEQEGHFGVIIGMDIITRGDFAITNINGKTTFSFRLPSVGTIDFVEESKKKEKEEKKALQEKLDRSYPCPCGSGNEFKHCHGKNL